MQASQTSTAEQDWAGSNPATPGTSRQMLLTDSVGAGLLRTDTLDANPGFINPHELSQPGPNDVSWVTYPNSDQVSSIFEFLAKPRLELPKALG